jgi:hypothetical protein
MSISRKSGAARGVLVVLGMTAALTVAPAATVLAANGAPASCMGHEASSISPPGSSGELPGGMPQLKAFIDEAFPGIPPGVIYSTISKFHEGSHEACDEVLD